MRGLMWSKKLAPSCRSYDDDDDDDNADNDDEDDVNEDDDDQWRTPS